MIALELVGDLHDAGAKARTLSRALAAGLPVLGGFVVLPAEEVDPAALGRALAALGGDRFVVRSSATVEDLPGASAAGVFESIVGVAKHRIGRADRPYGVAFEQQLQRRTIAL